MSTISAPSLAMEDSGNHDANLEKALLMSYALLFLKDIELLEIVKPLKRQAAIVRWFANRAFVMRVKPPGLQSLNVDGGHHRTVFLTSLANSVTNSVLFKLSPVVAGIEIAAYLAGGSVGIVCAMKAHLVLRRIMGR